MSDRMESDDRHETSAEEAEFIDRIEGAPLARRYGAYFLRGGPGYLQSAMTLGGGTAVSSVYAGRMFGFELLWVAPLGMLIGVLLLGVLAKLSLSAEERPYVAMSRRAGKVFALAWALGAIVASVIWHFPQYSLAGGALSDALDVAGQSVSPALCAVPVLGIALMMSFLYGRTPRLVRAYETVVKLLIAMVILCFALVVASTADTTDWGAVLAGFVPSLPEDKGATSSLTLVASGLGAAVGINMVLLYPYSLRARGWGKRHVECARFDLFAGMFVPYAIATSLVVIATANTIPWSAGEAVEKLKPIDAAQAFGGVLGATKGRLVFDLGLVGMALSTIALHMVACGFAIGEITGRGPGSLAYRLGTLLPVPGVLAPLVWDELLWLAIPTNIICGLFLPITYVGLILWAARERLRISRVTLVVMALATVLLTTVLTADVASKIASKFSS